MTECVANALMHVALVSNANLVGNADGHHRRTEKEVPVDWVGTKRIRVPSEKCQTIY